MADNTQSQTQPKGVQTTGHVWDGDLQEYNNPLPVWWTYAFYATIVFALVYWLIYPSWPIGNSFLRGMSEITFINSAGEEESWHWNSRAKLLVEMQAAAEAQKPYLERIAGLPYDVIVKDPELNSFVVSAGKVLYADNCAACHQAGGQGKVGFYPNLTDDDWLYGGGFEAIHESLIAGRRGYMPAYSEALPATDIDALTHYVLSLSGTRVDPDKAARGNTLFHSHAAACYYCHGDSAKGRQDLGAPNLTDQIWLWADVPGAADDAAKIRAVRQIIAGGLDQGVMPGWVGRLSPEQIKLLTVYVHQLGGGQ